jgi:hypothetical protein
MERYGSKRTVLPLMMVMMMRRMRRVWGKGNCNEPNNQKIEEYIKCWLHYKRGIPSTTQK